MKRFSYGLVAGFFGVFLGLSASYAAVALLAPNSAPAPAITNLIHLDEKLRFLRQHPEFDPTILAVGSSVTWRQLAGKAWDTLAGGPHRFLNGAVGYLQIHQTHALADFYLTHYRSVRTVVVMVSLPDFHNCTKEPRELFEPKDATRYAFGNWPSIYFLLRYFSPGRYVKTLLTLAHRRTPFTGDLYIDDYGSGPVKLPDDVHLGLRYGKIRIDSACVDALADLAQDMKQRGLRLVLVFTPVNPKYRVRYPAGIDNLTDMVAQLEREQLRDPDHFRVLDMVRNSAFAGADFYDAFHLQWPAVKRLSAEIVQALAAEPPLVPGKAQFSVNGR